ncbi:adhesion G protein-coupled receptor F4 [Centropristis striata]|uniref:adhesion G protein-coupled receptor F4 n=1 Tax=Centropristis striata TaxID=184440 RepID=UPI0027E049A5|nr:adhesion G protein-coupled receptor F4 [Centropristis striata]
MNSRMFFVLLGSVYFYYQVLAAGGDAVFISEMMVESNVTLDAKTILSALNTTSDLQVDGKSVTLLDSELVAECLITGDDTTCDCSTGYIWSNHICYNFNCCREATCKQNVSDIEPICIAKVQVQINGEVINYPGTWNVVKTDKLRQHFGSLNGFESLNVTGQRGEDTVADFVAAVSVKFDTSKLQEIVTKLEDELSAVLWVNTLGMVTIESPESTVCYESDPKLSCSFEQASDSAGWNLTIADRRFGLNKGSVVELATCDDFLSCTSVTLKKVTGIWSGTYECGFTRGSVRHTAKAQLNVAVLPDEITLTTYPLTVDCSDKVTNQVVKVTATIKNSTESYKVGWIYQESPQTEQTGPKPDGDNLVYTCDVSISCTETDQAHNVNVTFENSKNQTKSSKVAIPVIYAGKKFCKADGYDWPNTPDGDTVINRKCPPGRVGFKSRTCEREIWKDVFSSCINEELQKVSNAADNFLKGLGATQEDALDIFEGLLNSSSSNSDSNHTMADVAASVNVLNVMSEASENFELQMDVLPDFVESASNMLNKSWNGVNASITQNLSSTYLQSVEGLVKNIKINSSYGRNNYSTQNLDLKFCSGDNCNVTVFNINVNLNRTTGMLKTVAVKNLMDKLKNNFEDRATAISLLLSASVEDNENNTHDQSLKIKMVFPPELNGTKKHLCVFWDTKNRQWSKSGCNARPSENGTVCECNHLTSFSVLMSKGAVPDPVLDIITTVGLGVSICCLLIFLLVESLVWSAVVKSNLSHFRHTAIVNIATFLLIGDCCFLASADPEKLSDTLCLVLTISKHLSFLAMFSWMLCMSVMLVHQLIFVFSPLRKRVFMFFSSIVGYVCPILIVGSSYVYCKYTDTDYYTKDTGCWLVFEALLKGSIHAFLLPVGTVILTNLFSMVVVILTLVKSNIPEGKADDKETAKSILKVVVFLTPVFGVTWIIGFALLLLDNTDPMYKVADYAFTILNSFQGLFLLITGCFAEQKVREEVLKLINKKSNGKSESTKNLTSYTKDK